MTSKLSAYFPMLKTREQVLSKIRSSDELQKLFDSWTLEQQTEFLDFTTGVRGAKMLYDFMFKEILNPETVPERMEDLLSCLLGQKLKILRVLPNDSTRIADEASLLITDIVVELADGSIANVEVQKIGYAFPGERSACYSADLRNLRNFLRRRRSLRITAGWWSRSSVSGSMCWMCRRRSCWRSFRSLDRRRQISSPCLIMRISASRTRWTALEMRIRSRRETTFPC